MKLHNINYSSKNTLRLVKPILNKNPTILFSIIFYILNYHSFAQQNDTIFKNYIKIEKQKNDSLQILFKQKDKLKYLAVLPSLNYDIVNSSFNIGLNISNLTTYFQNKKRLEIEVEKMRLQLHEQQNLNLEKFTNEYEIIQANFQIVRLELTNTTLSNEIFNLKKSQYENNKISLEMWLNIQNEAKKNEIALLAKIKNLTAKMHQFEVKIKSPCFRQELLYLSINLPNQ